MRSDVGKPLAKLLKSSKVIKKLYLEFNELMVPGAKWIAKGISCNRTLEVLNIRGNIIGDEGMVLLSQSLPAATSLKELDISLNEIGPQGFQALCDVLPLSQITTLTCSKNFLGDEVLGYFATILTDPQQPCKLKKFDFSSCRLNDAGLIYLLNALQSSKAISSVRLQDNFFSENVEAILLEILNKNTSLTEIGLQGNRFSHSCLGKVKKIAQRNVRMIEEQEPNKLKAEIYRLNYEKQKLDNAKKKLKDQQDEIAKVQEYKKDLQSQMVHIKQEEEAKRKKLQDQIAAQKEQIKQKEHLIAEKRKKLETVSFIVYYFSCMLRWKASMTRSLRTSSSSTRQSWSARPSLTRS